MKILRYIPSAFFALVEIIIPWGLMDRYSYTDWYVLLLVSVILYCTIRSASISVLYTSAATLLTVNNSILELKKAIFRQNDFSAETSEMDEAAAALKRSRVKLFIRGFGVGVLYLVSLAYLFNR